MSVSNKYDGHIDKIIEQYNSWTQLQKGEVFLDITINNLRGKSNCLNTDQS